MSVACNKLMPYGAIPVLIVSKRLIETKLDESWMNHR